MFDFQLDSFDVMIITPDLNFARIPNLTVDRCERREVTTNSI